MPGHDVQRTSRSNDRVAPPSRPLWHRQFDALIPSRSQIITLEASGGAPPLILVTAADGIHALDPDNGAERWLYRMDMPPGDAPSVEGRMGFVAGTDGTVHAFLTSDGRRIWQTKRAGAPFYANPLVVNGRVYVGNRDGVFYCFDKATGDLLWHKRTNAPISYAAAYQSYPEIPEGMVVFASQDRCAYALDSASGEQVWESCDLPGATFIAYWPVIAGERVLLVSSASYPTVDFADLGALAREEVLLEQGPLNAKIDRQGRLDVSHHIDWLEKNPDRRSVIVLDRKTGAEAEVAPFLWWGNPGGQRYPPAVGADGVVWSMTAWLKSWFGSGRYAGWRVGDASVQIVPASVHRLESADEPEAYALIGGSIFHNDGGDGADKGGVFDPNGNEAVTWSIDVFYAAFGEYWGRWAERKYGSNLDVKDPNSPWGNSIGWHGHQNPPVPLGGKSLFPPFQRGDLHGAVGLTMKKWRPQSSLAPYRCLAFMLLAVVICGAQNLPTYESLEDRLATEVRKMIDAGHLAPGLSTFEQHYRSDSTRLGWELDDYWHNPAELVYTLSLAIKHLPLELRPEARAYLEAEFDRFPPTQYVHVGSEGARREYAPLPPAYASDWPAQFAQLEQPATIAKNWVGWRFNPFNIYACYKYAELFPNQAGDILNALREKVGPIPGDERFIRQHPHVVNVYIAGYFGYLGLQDLVGEQRSGTVESWLDDALAQRVSLLREGTEQLNGSEAGGFLWLVPELGDYLYDNARDLVLQAVKSYEWAAPYWFVSNAQETSRFWTGRTFMEGYHAHVYDAVSQFQARALALKSSRADLERYVDASSVARGDLYYIQNLCAAISATPGGVRDSRVRRYPLPRGGAARQR